MLTLKTTFEERAFSHAGYSSRGNWEILGVGRNEVGTGGSV